MFVRKSEIQKVLISLKGQLRLSKMFILQITNRLFNNSTAWAQSQQHQQRVQGPKS